MALATRCPACSTIFRISTAQAAAKGGMVRCGQCSNVFNSLDALVRVEDLDLVDEPVVEEQAFAAAVAASPPHAADPPDRAPDDEAVEAADDGFAHSEVSGVLASLSSPTEDHSGTHAWWMPDPTGRREPSAVPAPTTLHDPSPRAAISAALPAPDAPGPEGPADEPAAAPRGTAERGTNPVFMQPAWEGEPASRAARWTWGILSLVAALLLAGQVAYMERDELAARWSPARPWLAMACSALGCKVDHPAHAESITIESAAIQTSAPDANLYVLTALLRNSDTIDLRYPYLELVLTDVQDRTVLRRVLRPEDYTALVADPSFASPGFAAQSELPIRLTFELNDLKFAGYRLDRFYP